MRLYRWLQFVLWVYQTTPYKWLDLGKFCHAFLPNNNIHSIKYFTAKVSGRPGNLDAPIHQELYLRALRTIPSLEIIYGHFLTHSVYMPISGSNACRWVPVDKTEEKGSDVNLATYLLHDGFTGAYDTAVIVSNDSDLREPVRVVRKVLNLPVGIINPHTRNSRELQKHATFVKRIRGNHLVSSQFPPSLTDQGGSFVKPRGW